MTKEFKVNKYITLKLCDEKDVSKRVDVGDTLIYVNGELFKQCMFILLAEIKGSDMLDYQEGVSDMVAEAAITSIDDLAEKLDVSLEEQRPDNIPSETLFWAHCSNLQAWSESRYDSRLLHSNLAFPLLKKLTKVGDPRARRVFKDEIARRFSEGGFSTREYLLQGYMKYLSDDELLAIFPREASIIKEIKDELNCGLLIRSSESNAFLNNKEGVNQFGIALKGEKIITVSFRKFKLPKRTWEWIFEKLSEIKTFETLYIIKSELDALPDSIGRFKNLKTLKIYDNRLKTFPDSIGELKSLEKIFADRNELEVLPDSIGNLKSLKRFFFSNNELTTLPDSFGNLKSLEVFHAHDNQLKSVPESIGKLEHLQIIHLDRNQLDSMPLSLLDLKCLSTLIISNNNLNLGDEVFRKMRYRRRKRRREKNRSEKKKLLKQHHLPVNVALPLRSHKKPQGP